LDAVGNASQGEIVVVVVAAAAFSCLVGWLLEGGFETLRERYQGWLASTPGAPGRRVRAVDDGAREFGEEFVRALAVAVKSSVESASDEQAIIDAIVTQLGWSPTRARWFIAVNREQVEQAASQMGPDAPSDRRASCG
jgi:hypothetical protein